MVKRKTENVRNKIFFCLLSAIFIFGASAFIWDPKDVSKSENRSLYQFPHFSITSFIEGNYQDTFELALADQFVGSEPIRNRYNSAMVNLPTFGVMSSICKGNYLMIPTKNNDRSIYDCYHSIVYYPIAPDTKKQDVLDQTIAKFNKINKTVDTYYYFINESSVYDFRDNSFVFDYPNYLRNHLEGNYHLASFNVDNFDEYTKYFYKTDHHWNNQGQLKGYAEIINLLGVTDQPIQPVDTYTSHEPSFGTHTQITKKYDYPEDFTVNIYQYPEHATVCNDDPELACNHFQDYLDHNYDYNRDFYFYSYAYGGDYAKIAIDYHQPDRDNLLVIANSFSNPINELIASHFNQTYVLDLRNYYAAYQKDFEFSKFIKEHHINKVLFIISSVTFNTINSSKGLES